MSKMMYSHILALLLSHHLWVTPTLNNLLFNRLFYLLAQMLLEAIGLTLAIFDNGRHVSQSTLLDARIELAGEIFQ
jgi:hypothetical protein